MEEIKINQTTCIHCGQCAAICPVKIMRQDAATKEIALVNQKACIRCGHCAAICPVDAVLHPDFPASKLHKVNRSELPTPESVELLIKYRRSNRAFSDKTIPHEQLLRILEAAHRAPTATNAQELSFTLVTSPEKIKAVTEFTLDTFQAILKKLQNPMLKPLLKRMMPQAYNYIPAFHMLIDGYRQGYDGILRGATALVFIHAPKTSKYGMADANLAYQNASLMAESLGVSQFYTGFVLAAFQQDKTRALNEILEVDGLIHAGMALGIPKYRFSKYMDKEPIRFNEI